MLIDQSYFEPRHLVSIIALGDSGEALLVRAMLESLGAAVLLHFVGMPEDFLRTLERDEHDPRLIVICGHGDENGFILGDFDEAMGGGLLVDGALPPAAIGARARLRGAVVLSTACLTGSDAFSTAMLQAGAAAYVAPSDYPEGADVPLFVHHFFHSLLRRGCDARQAFDRARATDTGFASFRLYENVVAGSSDPQRSV